MLEELKRYLKITWEDEDDALTEFLQAGQAYLRSITGQDINFEEDAQARALLMDYARYRYHNVIEEYEGSFASLLLNLQIRYGIEAMG